MNATGGILWIGRAVPPDPVSHERSPLDANP